MNRRNNLVKWFERQLNEVKDPRKEELVKYMIEYKNHILIEQVQDAYLPGIFFVNGINPNEIITYTTWTSGLPSVFPPTDLIGIVKFHGNQEDHSILGQISTTDFIEILRPHLQSIDGYNFTKKLTRECKYIDMLESFIKDMLDPIPGPGHVIG